MSKQASSVVVAVMCACASAALGGPLLPPVGPVTSTGKTLTQIEPRTEINSTNTPGDADSVFRITQPGSYYLSGNVLANAKFGIEIVAANVTVDLNGFRVGGTNGALGGIVTDGSFLSGITVKNGTVTGFAGPGINLTRLGNGFADNNTGASVLNVQVSSVTGLGIRIESGVIAQCSTSFALLGGLSTLEEVSITDCHISDSTDGPGVSVNGSAHVTIERVTARNCSVGFSIRSGGSTIVRGCAAESNAGFGFDALSAALVDCVATQNGTSGFFVDGCTVTGCFSENHPDSGFIVRKSTVVRSKAERNTQVGFDVERGIVEACVAVDSFGDSSGLDRGYGFQLRDGAIALNCLAENNSFGGYVMTGNSSRLEGCHAVANLFAQYQTTFAARNTVMLRCQAGIRSVGSAPKGFVTSGQNAIIEECVSSGHTVSQFEIGGANNIVMRSRALTATGAFVIGAGNNVAPVVNFSAIGTNTNPHANFTR